MLRWAAHPIISCILSFIRAHGDNDKDDDLYSRDDDEDSSGVSDTINVIWWNKTSSQASCYASLKL